MIHQPPTHLIELAHFLGDPAEDQCILAEGNVSCRSSEGRIWVKASGHQMAKVGPSGFVEVESAPILGALDRPEPSVAEVRKLLNASMVPGASDKTQPSTESFMHAYLLSLDGVEFVAHGHPTPLLSLLCLDSASEWAGRRMFPDEIVCCGPAACFVPYVAPGLRLAAEIRSAVQRFRTDWGIDPKTIWLQNHGLIALAKTAKEAMSICSMSVKAARVLLGALESWSEIRWMTKEEVSAIYEWPDEHFRQRALRGE